MKIVFPISLMFVALGRVGAADSITFSENYVERLATAGTVITTRAGSFKAAVTHPELGCVPLTLGMSVEVTLGGFSFQAVLGTADQVTTTQYTFFIRDNDGRRIGTVALGRIASQLIITGTFSQWPASPVAEGLAGEAGPVSGSIPARVVFGGFQVERPAYYAGRQTVTQTTVGTNPPELVRLHAITVTGNADFAPPQLTVAAPRSGQRFETNSVEFRGTTRDNVRATVVFVQVNGADLEPITPAETGEWAGSAVLVPGTNTLAVWALDADGNASPTNRLRVFHVVGAFLDLAWDGAGSVSGLTNGQRLEIGRSYTVTARPAAASRFGGWTGGGEYGPVDEAAAAMKFIMQPGLALRASFIPPVFTPLVLDVTPGNQVTGVSNEMVLEVGKTYQAIAKPGPGQLFLNWSGSAASTNAILRFITRSNMALHANFIPNPWLAAAGNYAGLIEEEGLEAYAAPFNNGSFTLTLTAGGRVTGKLRLRGETLPFSAQAGLDGTVRARVTRPKCIEPLLLELLFDLEGLSGGVVSGVVSSPTIYTGLSGQRAAGDATYAGRYTFRMLTGTEDDSPGGEGAGTMLVDARGNVTVSGTLGDGTPVAFSTVVFANGAAPFHLPLYVGRGLLQSWVNFATNIPPLHASGESVIWFKALARSDRYYPAGFVTRRVFMGMRYTPPVPGANVLPWSEGVLLFEGGNLPDALGNTVHVTNNLVRVADNFPKASIAITPRTGLFAVSFVNPITRQTWKGNGALLQFDPPYEGFGFPVSGMGGGWFRGIIESGYVRLLPLAPE